MNTFILSKITYNPVVLKRGLFNGSFWLDSLVQFTQGQNWQWTHRGNLLTEMLLGFNDSTASRNKNWTSW